MKKLIPAFLLILTTVSICFAQISVTPKKTVYTRKIKVDFKEKRTFVVTYPQISGSISPAAKKKLENTINYWRVFGTTLQENITENYWLEELSYNVGYNKNGILDIALTQEGSGAYPDQSTFDFVINLKTGEQVKFKDAFKAGTLDGFAKMVDAKLKAETKKIIKDTESEPGENGKEADDLLKEQLNALSFTAETFDEYSVSDKGVTIFYDAGFPHVSQALQPDGRYFFTWAQVKPFVKSDGIFGKFIR